MAVYQSRIDARMAARDKALSAVHLLDEALRANPDAATQLAIEALAEALAGLVQVPRLPDQAHEPEGGLWRRVGDEEHPA